MKNIYLITVLYFCSFYYTRSQNNSSKVLSTNNKPKLIIGIMVDQMRVDYLYRYEKKYSNNGLKKLMQKGSFFANAHFNYAPTVTGPGHASIFTGTTPSVHGIVGNYWFDPKIKKTFYCVKDDSVNCIGIESKSHKTSPKNCISSTIGDELKLASNGKSKVYGVSQKDRAAILPAGHMADGAYWLDGISGKFISSSFYDKKLPSWLNNFNQLNLAEKYLKNGWKTLLPIDQYTESMPDDNPYEAGIGAKGKQTFPYDFTEELNKKEYRILSTTPYGNTLTKDLAVDLILNEQLGQDEYTDLLTISFSSTDIIGHTFGIRSIEVEDTYLRLDKDIEDLLNLLESKIGKDNFVVFLTADHGGAENWQYLKDSRISAGEIDQKEIDTKIKSLFASYFNDSLLLAFENNQLYLNDEVLQNKKIDLKDVQLKLSQYIRQGNLNGANGVYLSQDIINSTYQPYENLYFIKNGLYANRCGQIVLSFDPGYIDWSKEGTTHETPYSYDTHVPVIFYGANIKAGTLYEKVMITQIAPTISFLLNIQKPNGCLYEPIQSVLKK